MLRTLQEKKLVQREEHATDTRAKVVVLSEAGKKLVKQAVVAVESFDQAFFRVLGSKTPAFNQRLLQLLQQEIAT